MNQPPASLVLASQSEGRKMLLETLKIPFSVMPSTIDEDKIISPDPVETIRLRAKRKAEDVLSKFQIPNSKFQNSVMILSADSGAILDGKIYGKPSSLKEAQTMLGTLAGRVQTFITCSYIILLTKDIRKGINNENYQPEIILDDTDRSLVTFRKMTKEDIDLYLSLTDYQKYAGSYALYTSPQIFISKIKGSLSSVVGLPLEKIIPVFKKYNLLSLPPSR